MGVLFSHTHLDHNPAPSAASHPLFLCVLLPALPQVQLGVTRAARGSGQGHQWLGWRQLPLVRQHHGDGHPHRPYVQTVPSDGQHERQFLPQCDLGCAHQQQQHTHADPHHQGPEFHHLAGGHELCHQGRAETPWEWLLFAHRNKRNKMAIYLQKPLFHFTLPGYDVITFSCTFPVWCKVTKYHIIAFNSPYIAAAAAFKKSAQHKMGIRMFSVFLYFLLKKIFSIRRGGERACICFVLAARF